MQKVEEHVGVDPSTLSKSMRSAMLLLVVVALASFQPTLAMKCVMQSKHTSQPGWWNLVTLSRALMY